LIGKRGRAAEEKREEERGPSSGGASLGHAKRQKSRRLGTGVPVNLRVPTEQGKGKKKDLA